jgi:RNA polymerase sigma-70 factor (ECF subfamily)
MIEFGRLLTKLRQYLRHRGRTDEDADDLIQEAFLRLEVYGRQNEVEHQEAFLMRTVANLSVDKYRHDTVLEVLAMPVEELEILDTRPSPEQVCAAREEIHRLAAALESLSPTTREILMARRYEGLSCPEIAERYGVSTSAVEKRLARAMLHLMRSMRES